MVTAEVAEETVNVPPPATVTVKLFPAVDNVALMLIAARSPAVTVEADAVVAIA